MERERILLVEDDEYVAQGLSRLLVLLGYEVERCDSSEVALEKLNMTGFDLVISDLRLPGMSGLELLERVRRARPVLRSILITAFHSPQAQSQACRWANAYLSKPFEMEHFAQTVKRVLRSTPETLCQAESIGIHGRLDVLPENESR